MRTAILFSAYIIARAIDKTATSELLWHIVIMMIAFILWDSIEFLIDHLEIRKQGKVEY